MENDLAKALAGHGLILRCGFNFAEGETAPSMTSAIPRLPLGGEVARRSRDGDFSDIDGASSVSAKSVMLVGQAGSAPWPHFLAWRASQPVDLPNPLDSWSREIVGDIAEQFGARAVSPSDRPYLPFQQWAMRAEELKPSPLGILMHPEYGLWHAYRGALLFDHQMAIQAPDAAIHLCDACVGKPCLKACPVGAYSSDGFAYERCKAHVRGAGVPCRTSGCLDRNACPYGAAYRYPAEMQAFHMASFIG